MKAFGWEEVKAVYRREVVLKFVLYFG
jgi:hypothetical protein